IGRGALQRAAVGVVAVVRGSRSIAAGADLVPQAIVRVVRVTGGDAARSTRDGLREAVADAVVGPGRGAIQHAVARGDRFRNQSPHTVVRVGRSAGDTQVIGVLDRRAQAAGI